MDRLTTENLTSLANASGEPLLSLYMPTERAGREVQQNRIRFKNLIDDARKTLEGKSAEALGNQLDELAKQEEDDPFWQQHSDGLCFFLDGKQVQRWRLPADFQLLAVCSDRYHIRPLCRYLQDDGRFYILAVSQNDVRLFLGTKDSIAELEEADLPSDLRSALNIDEYVSSLQHHSTASDGGEAMFHGHGGSDPDVQKQDEIKQYFHHIDAALSSFFGTERTPLVFAGVEYLFPLFRETCSYNRLIEEPVKGNPDDLTGEELHEKAWPLVGKLFDKQRGEILEQYGTAQANQLGSDDIQIVLPAAKQGQVQTLITAEGEHLWMGSDEGKLPQEGAAEDLVNAAVVATLTNGGEVLSAHKEQLGEKPLAAIMRFPLNASQLEEAETN
ncbi:MAG: hypothetical protein RID07_05300 [Lacipirellulaceae bacterium]